MSKTGNVFISIILCGFVGALRWDSGCLRFCHCGGISATLRPPGLGGSRPIFAGAVRHLRRLRTRGHLRSGSHSPWPGKSSRADFFVGTLRHCLSRHSPLRSVQFLKKVFVTTLGIKKDAEQRPNRRPNLVLAASARLGTAAGNWSAWLRRNSVVAAWASLGAGVVSCGGAMLWGLSQVDKVVQEKGTAVFLALLLVSGAGGFAGVKSLFDIRSWWDALLIIPVAVFGILINGFVVIACVAYLCECIAHLLGFGPR